MAGEVVVTAAAAVNVVALRRRKRRRTDSEEPGPSPKKLRLRPTPIALTHHVGLKRARPSPPSEAKRRRIVQVNKPPSEYAIPAEDAEWHSVVVRLRGWTGVVAVYHVQDALNALVHRRWLEQLAVRWLATRRRTRAYTPP
ncbi:hypothetical protein B0H14DRAFT_2556189 [Mycena olivaceomarginata]|nr:hypothetical protein B0H14DRAFT_2556189 [Mycena olivaceomarginata]